MATVGDVAEGKGSEEAVAISSHPAEGVEFGVECFVELGFDFRGKLVLPFGDVHGVGDGRHWVLDGLEFFVDLLVPVTGTVLVAGYHATNVYNA